MNHTIAQLHALALAALLGALMPAPAAAELQVTQSTQQPRAAAPAKSAAGERAGEARRDPEKPLTLRCWQFGRLILEEPVVAAPAGEDSRSFTRPGDSRPIELLRLGDAVCLVR